jgi:hypothetical protein
MKHYKVSVAIQECNDEGTMDAGMRCGQAVDTLTADALVFRMAHPEDYARRELVALLLTAWDYVRRESPRTGSSLRVGDILTGGHAVDPVTMKATERPQRFVVTHIPKDKV